jgi:protoheme IX farnesyltransferase
MKKATIKDYYKLAKPGIIYGNLLTTIAAFLFALQGYFSLVALFVGVMTALGISLVIGSACVFNNYLDRELDAKMARTSTRALVTGIISNRSALIYGTVLGAIGLSLLVVYVNLLTAYIALFGFFMYVVVYGFVKRKSYLGALVGSIPGAVPIVVGYTAVTGQLDAAALILFLILVTWQMPHFYAIALYRLDEYKAAGIPVLPAIKGEKTTRRHIIGYIVSYIIAVSALWEFGYAGYTYLILVLLFAAVWLFYALNGSAPRKIFFFSLIVLLFFCVSISISSFLP